LVVRITSQSKYQDGCPSESEYKFEGNIGQLERRHIQVSKIVHIGKEANNIEEQPLKKVDAQVFRHKQSICKNVTQKNPELIERPSNG
jgi:hypothetical protein